MKTYIIALILSLISTLQAQIITDGSVGSKLTLSGPDFIINQTLGSRVGNNLFHSFKTFSINNQESATFTGSPDIANVISRVTGGEISNINGLLKSTIGTADFYFFNPSGIVFGPDAVVDVPAAFHVSTADKLTLEDGSVFSAINPTGSSLGIAKPESFGYLNRQATSLTINGSLLTLSSSGDLSISSSHIQISNGAYIATDAGTINITAVGEQEMIVPIADIGEVEALGYIQLLNGSAISSSTYSEKNSGDINIQTGSMLIDGGETHQHTYIENYTMSEFGNSGDININANASLIIIDGLIINANYYKGEIGDININAKDLYLSVVNSQNLVGISNQALQGSTANSGNINMKITDLLEIKNQAEISTTTYSVGDAGTLNIHAGAITVDGNWQNAVTGVTSKAYSGSTGNSGDINIVSDSGLTIIHGAEISSDARSSGDAGNLNIQAKELYIEGEDPNIFTGISSLTSSDLIDAGNAGDININIDGLVSIVDSAKILSTTWSSGDSGDINIDAKDMLIDGKNSIIESMTKIGTLHLNRVFVLRTIVATRRDTENRTFNICFVNRLFPDL